jgi:hypothetical protein
LQRIQTPTLIVVVDEDEGGIEPALLLKRSIGPSGLLMLPRTGHTVNLKEHNAFNPALLQFLLTVENGRRRARNSSLPTAGAWDSLADATWSTTDDPRGPSGPAPVRRQGPQQPSAVIDNRTRSQAWA